MDTTKRLVYNPCGEDKWLLESISDSGQIMDCVGLTAMGAARHVGKEALLASLRAAIEELEAA